MKRRILFFGIIAIMLSGTFIEKGWSMGIFEKIFGSQKDTTEMDLSKHKQYLDSLRKPAILIEKGEKSSFSKIGGLPIANTTLQWPIWKGKPLAFLCQIDLSAIPKSEATNILPSNGLLYFFYDQEQSTWGFDPKDKGSWRVIYLPGKDELNPLNAPPGLKQEYIYKEKHIIFSEVLSYPDSQDDRIAKLNLNDEQSDEYFELCSSIYKNQTAHQLLGYPSPIQENDMDLESQLVSNGLYCGDAT